MTLDELGWTPARAAPFKTYARPGRVPARVARQDRAGYRVHGADGVAPAVAAGRLRHHDTDIAIGDWVVVDSRTTPHVIHAVLPRTGTFVRKRAGTSTTHQTIAANVDWLLLVSGLDGDFNPRRIERYLALAWNCGAAPVIVLNKADVCADAPGRRAAVEAIAAGVPVHVLSATALDPDHPLRPYLQTGKTLAAVGSSGAGKSTLINALLGEARQHTAGVRRGDDRGRHTTTRRELFVLPEGGLIIDTPGMRELQLWTDDTAVDGAFADIDRLATQCRFGDCTHSHEPGCAVRAATTVGDLDPARLDSYHTLQKEVRHLERQQDIRTRLDDKARAKALHRAFRRNQKRR